ncbi:DUF4190 domain-containing protein [Gordonia sp. PKS22-38]|uniref:DUF4190 domain-containing protein n=1 Tax=Gordonia prachuapensis TaxID=3115651 RepID=A0ABU7MP71_9ACTN|nr:DUF4190 domain-containing protein [Gordonia sp. PKS22-38]
MRGTDHPTDSIPPAVTDQIATWPVDNHDTGYHEIGYHDTAGYDRDAFTPDDHVVRSDDHDRLPPVTPPSVFAPIHPTADRPLPTPADIWVPSVPDATSPPARRHRQTSSAMATTALVTSIVSLPLALIGVGAIIGFVGTVLGVVAVIQIAAGRRPAPEPNRYRGAGRAITAAALGIVSMAIGAPILLVILMFMAVV